MCSQYKRLIGKSCHWWTLWTETLYFQLKSTKKHIISCDWCLNHSLTLRTTLGSNVKVCPNYVPLLLTIWIKIYAAKFRFKHHNLDIWCCDWIVCVEVEFFSFAKFYLAVVLCKSVFVLRCKMICQVICYWCCNMLQQQLISRLIILY